MLATSLIRAGARSASLTPKALTRRHGPEKSGVLPSRLSAYSIGVVSDVVCLASMLHISTQVEIDVLSLVVIGNDAV